MCSEVIELDQTLCEKCKKTKKIMQPICLYCGANKDECNCNHKKMEYKAVVAPYYFSGQVKSAVYRFKSGGNTFLSKSFGEDMAICIKENLPDVKFDVITFVPLRKLKRLKRGFNQSELLAEVVSEKLNVKCDELLYKARYTGVQHNKNAKQRAADVFGAYDVYEEYQNLEGKTILIIDDIKTTGSTLNECAKMLKIYGAHEVYACTYAVTNNTNKKSD